MPLDDDILAACQPLLDDLATQWLASLAEFDFSFLRDMPRARRRSFRQRDLSRALRAAKAAGITVREITADGRLILETGATAITKPVGAQSWDVAIDKLRLKYIHAYRDRHGKRRFYAGVRAGRRFPCRACRAPPRSWPPITPPWRASKCRR